MRTSYFFKKIYLSIGCTLILFMLHSQSDPSSFLPEEISGLERKRSIGKFHNSSAKTVTKREVKSAIAEAVSEMKSEFRNTRSTAGLTGMIQAVTNTLNDAVSDGWIKSNCRTQLISIS